MRSHSGMSVGRLGDKIAALPFVFSAVSESRYRERFFDPIMADMRRAILVREAVSTTPAPLPS